MKQRQYASVVEPFKNLKTSFSISLSPQCTFERHSLANMVHSEPAPRKYTHRATYIPACRGDSTSQLEQTLFTWGGEGTTTVNSCAPEVDSLKGARQRPSLELLAVRVVAREQQLRDPPLHHSSSQKLQVAAVVAKFAVLVLDLHCDDGSP